MLRKQMAQRQQRAAVVAGAGMIGAPTVVPTTGFEGQGIPMQDTDPYFAIEVDTTNETAAVKIVLFDGSRGYQSSTGYQMPTSVGIRGITADYDFMLTDLVHNASYFDTLKLRVIAGNLTSSEQIALIQYAHPFKLYTSTKGSEARLVKTIFPDMGIHEMQQRLEINTFTSPTIITNREALVYTQEPGIKLVLGFYQKAEIGRNQ